MDINYDELFGIESAAPEAEETPAEPAEETQEQPAQEQPVEEPAGQPEEQGEGNPPVPQEMSKEERARQAEGRRIREREARAREEGRAAERAHFSEIVKRMGWTNPSTQKPITTVDEFEAYDRELTKSRFDAGNPTESDVRMVVQEEIAKSAAPRRAEPQAEPTGDPRISPMEDQLIQAELAQLSAMDPDVKDLQSILTGPYGDKFRGYVAKGLSFVESYKLAAEEKLSQRRTGQAAEAARIKAASKDHLSATGARGQGALSVPADEMALFRELLPDAKPEEIQAYYNQDRKRYGPK